MNSEQLECNEYVLKEAKILWEKKNEDALSEDELLDGLDEDLDFISFRERRIEEMKAHIVRLRAMQKGPHGKYSEISDEKEVIQASASEERCVIHFAHRDFRRCQIMDEHLEKVARKYFSTRFIKVYVENAPWLVTKLSVKILPCVLCLVKGSIKARLIGFEELGNNDQFTTSALELKLKACDVVEEDFSQAKSRRVDVERKNGEEDDEIDL